MWPWARHILHATSAVLAARWSTPTDLDGMDHAHSLLLQIYVDHQHISSSSSSSCDQAAFTGNNCSETEHQTDDEEVTDDDDGGDEDDDDEDETEDEDRAEEVEGKERDETEESDVSKKSAVFCHLLSRPDCLSVYDDSHFSVLCRASYVKQLKVLEAVCIRVHNPVLCKQKKKVVYIR
ncbi:transcription termination factor 4, mitochondrial-like [Sycon ciliatum]|uniref:transcription termination factor 4, mitochondrial-like n=1 Tax=Sycon ciliatum TaxID=27933 RepID=UPI0031F67EE3